MKLPITGGCVCGEIRYECGAEPIMMLVPLPIASRSRRRVCCRRAAGEGVPVDGELSYHFTPSLAGEAQTRLCAQCSSRITGAEKQKPPSRHWHPRW
jgi:hypothetical protein